MLNLTRWLVIAIAAMGVNLIVHQAADAFRHFTCLGPDIARMHRTFAKALAERDAVLQA